MARMKLRLPTRKDALWGGLFVTRHGVVWLAITFLACVLWTVIYGLLMIISTLGGYPTGSPAVYPVFLILIVIYLGGVGWGVFIPACAVGRLFCWLTRFPKLTAIPVVLLTAMGIASLLRHLLTSQQGSTWVNATGDVIKHDLWWLTLGLGVYWWVTEGPGALWDAISRFIRRKRQGIHRGEQQDVPAVQLHADEKGS
jgi:hypothetical protein